MSDIVFKIVMFVCFYMALPIMYGMLRNEAKPKKNLLIGATIPLWERDGKEVQDIVKKYKRTWIYPLLFLRCFPWQCFSLITRLCFYVRYGMACCGYDCSFCCICKV